jgi:type IV secretory pathway TrbL component
MKECVHKNITGSGAAANKAKTVGADAALTWAAKAESERDRKETDGKAGL